MTGKAPSILVVASDWDERARIAFTLREAGFSAAVAADHPTAAANLRRHPCAASIIALPGDGGAGLLQDLRRRYPALPALLVLSPAALRSVDEDFATVLKRPIDYRQLLGCAFELVLRGEAGPDTVLQDNRAAELSIAAAGLACLANRRAVAAATGASALAQDLSRDISEAQRHCQQLALARALGARRGDNWAGY